MREKEFRQISQNLIKLPNLASNSEDRASIQDALDNNNVCILGDLNLHHPNENRFLDQNQLNDLWLEFYSHEEGITWDPARNRMINVMLPFDNRRMRLDRILLKNSAQLDLEDI